MFIPVTAIAIFTPALSLSVAWAFWRQPRPSTLRDNVTFCGLVAASLTTADLVGSLLDGSVRGSKSMAGSSGEFWMISGWIAFALWVVAAVASMIGQGKARRGLAAWTLLVFLADYVVMAIMSA